MNLRQKRTYCNNTHTRISLLTFKLKNKNHFGNRRQQFLIRKNKENFDFLQIKSEKQFYTTFNFGFFIFFPFIFPLILLYDLRETLSYEKLNFLKYENFGKLVIESEGRKRMFGGIKWGKI